MSTATARKTGGLEARTFGWVDARLPGEGPPWLTRLRFAAAERLREDGLPTGREEAWRFTALTELARTELTPADDGEADVSWIDARLPEAALRVVLVDGFAHVVGRAPDGVSVDLLGAACEQNPSFAEGLLGRQAHLERPFDALNTVMFRDGVVLRVAAGTEVPETIQVVHAHSGREGVTSHPRILVVAEANAKVRLLEAYLGREGAYLVNPVTEVLVTQGASVDHVRLAYDAPEAFHLGALSAEVARDGRYASRVVSLGGRLTRLDLDVRLTGRGAECDLDGLYLAGGEQTVDHHTLVDHVSPGATSREVYKGILDGHGHGVFDGTIIVRPDAQKTSGAQQNRNLLLSDDARVDTKPHLAIDADDVKASHGATVGQLDEDQLFYLRSRGLGLNEARAVLTWGFAREVVSRIPDEALRTRVGREVLSRLPDGDRILELA